MRLSDSYGTLPTSYRLNTILTTSFVYIVLLDIVTYPLGMVILEAPWHNLLNWLIGEILLRPPICLTELMVELYNTLLPTD